MVGVTIGLGLIVIGVVLLAVETATPGFFVGAIGTAFLVMGIISMLFSDDILMTFWAPVIMILSAFFGMLISLWLYKSLGRVHPPSTTVTESIVGKTGIVTHDTDPDSDTRGKVRVGTTVWSATSDSVIREGTRVEVLEAEGVHVKVRALRAKAR